MDGNKNEEDKDLRKSEELADMAGMRALVLLYFSPLILSTAISLDNTRNIYLAACKRNNTICYQLYSEEGHEEKYNSSKDYCRPLGEIAKNRIEGIVNRFSLLQRLQYSYQRK